MHAVKLGGKKSGKRDTLKGFKKTSSMWRK